MSNYRKFIIIGLQDCGKDDFMKSLSWYPPVRILKKIAGHSDYIRMTNGRCKVPDQMIYLYCLEEELQMELLKSLFSEAFDAVLYIADISKIAAGDYVKKVNEHLTSFQSILNDSKPVFVLANRTDASLSESSSIKSLKLSPQQQLINVSSMEKKDSMEAIRLIAAKI